jgi:hypothetical protein
MGYQSPVSNSSKPNLLISEFWVNCKLRIDIL